MSLEVTSKIYKAIPLVVHPIAYISQYIHFGGGGVGRWHTLYTGTTFHVTSTLCVISSSFFLLLDRMFILTFYPWDSEMDSFVFLNFDMSLVADKDFSQ